MIELLFEFLFQVAAEAVIQGAFELGFRGLAEPLRKDRPANPVIAICGFVFIGAISGAISIWILPMHLLKNPVAQYINLAATPIALGFMFEWLGRRRQKKGKQKMLLDRFSYGFVFALMMGLIRFYFAE